MPDAVNNSWSDYFTGNCSEIYSSILNTLEATKIAVVFSAGNDGPDISSLPAPKNINTSLVNTFTVGSVKNSLEISYSSGRGPSICPGEGSISIKPEISAPGENVRSCYPDGTYGLNSGTSMAAPHVSGAMLLLREAFPNTTGTEVKMALYMSATDLGEIGEDNTFGMGIINLPAAYDYLIGQGHIPIPPLSQERDIIALNLEVSPISCPELFQFNISFENAGVEPLTELVIEYNIGSFSGIYQWTGNLLPDEFTSVFIEDSNVPIGDYQLEVILTNPNGLVDDRFLNNKIIREIDINDTTPTLIYTEGNLEEYCDASEVYLRVDYQGIGDIEVEWFDQISGGNSIGSGSVFNVGMVGETQTFFAGLNYFWPVGKTSLGTTDGFPEATNPGIQFDALQDFKLNSVLVYFETPGARLISLEDSNGEEIASKIVNVTGDGQKRVSLGFDLTQGNDYLLKFKQGAPLLSDIEGAQFPYTIDDVVRLDKSLAVTDEQSLLEYHCFYDWEIEIPSRCGRIPLTVDVIVGDNVPSADFTSSQTEIELIDGEAMVEFTNTSEGATSFVWNFADGTTDDTNESTMHTFTELGTYVVSLTVFNTDGCSDTELMEITITEDMTMTSNNNVSLALWDITLFPNPTQDKITINFALEEAQNLSYRVVDLYGRTITATNPQNIGTAQVSLDMSDVSAGIYYLIFENNEQQRMVRKLVKM